MRHVLPLILALASCQTAPAQAQMAAPARVPLDDFPTVASVVDSLRADAWQALVSTRGLAPGRYRVRVVAGVERVAVPLVVAR